MMTNKQKAKEIIAMSDTKQVYDIVDFKSLEEALYDDLMEMAKWKDAQRRTPSDDTTEGFIHLIIGEVACHETEVERQIKQGKAFVEHNKTVFEVAMAVANFFDTQLQMKMDAIKELSERIDAYHDKTLITADFLIRNGFEKREYDYLYSDEVAEITAQNIDSEAGVWRIEVAYLDDGYPQTLDICTVGQLRMFLKIEQIAL